MPSECAWLNTNMQRIYRFTVVRDSILTECKVYALYSSHLTRSPRWVCEKFQRLFLTVQNFHVHQNWKRFGYKLHLFTSNILIVFSLPTAPVKTAVWFFFHLYTVYFCSCFKRHFGDWPSSYSFFCYWPRDCWPGMWFMAENQISCIHCYFSNMTENCVAFWSKDVHVSFGCLL